MSDTWMPVGQFAIAADHPSLPGHFPGRPVVPGVVLLDHALALVLPPPARPMAPCRIRFMAVIRPGEAVDTLAGPAHGGRIDFIGRRGGQTVLRGSVAVAP